MLGGDAGFSIIETAVAGSLAAIFVIGMGMSMLLAMSGARDSRLQQAAQSVALERIELARGTPWEGLRMSAIHADAPFLNSSQTAVSADAASLVADEVLAVDGTDGVIEPLVVQDREGVTYTVWTYVTAPDFDTRRVIVDVRWDVDGRPEQFVSSTLMSGASS